MGWLDPAAPGWPARLGVIRTGAGVVGLRPLRNSDGGNWRRMRLQDEALIRPRDPTSSLDWGQRHSRSAWLQHRTMLRQAGRRGTALPFAITVDSMFVGQLTIGAIQRFPLHGGWIGYWVGSEFTGHGVATVASALAVGHAFGPAQLHRLEATVSPDNVASQRVLGHLGFRQEGLLRRYLDIDGAWRDHQLWALTADEAPGGAAQLLDRWTHTGPAQT